MHPPTPDPRCCGARPARSLRRRSETIPRRTRMATKAARSQRTRASLAANGGDLTKTASPFASGHAAHHTFHFDTKAPTPCYTRSGLVRHELSLVDITYPSASIKATKPGLPSTVLVHYINGEVETDRDLLPFADPPNPLVRLKEKRSSVSRPPARAVSAGASSRFRSQAEIEAELPRPPFSVGHASGHAQVPSSSCPTQATSSIFDEEMEAALHSICAEDGSISDFFS